MKYSCDHCNWTGTWDEMILETLCPLCRGSVQPAAADDKTLTGTGRRSRSTVTTSAPSR